VAYIEIFPKSIAAQQRLTDSCAAVMALLFQSAKDVLNVPDHDIIIELNQSTAIAFNAEAMKAASVPDVVIKISTSDHELQPRFPALCDEVVKNWDALFGTTLKSEVWVNLIETWGCNMDFG
jgi:hypothetical protein